VKYRAIVLDIDGTLIFHERGRPTEACVQALHALKERGVLVIIATGRGPFISTPKALAGLQADYLVCANGSYVVSRDGQVLHEDRLDAQHLERLVDFAEARGHHLYFTFEDAYYLYAKPPTPQQEKPKKDEKKPSFILDGRGVLRHNDGMPYGAFCLMPREDTLRYCAAWPGLKMMESQKGAYDICSETSDKAVGVGVLLEKLGLSWEQVVAVGDGENDIGMLARAGMGVAMGNARDHVKNAANYVTGSVEADGVLQVVKQFFSDDA